MTDRRRHALPWCTAIRDERRRDATITPAPPRWVQQWQHIDKNGDLPVCMKARPITPGNPAYSFNGVDDTAS